MKKNENRPGYKKTKVGWIPEDWECLPFTSIFERIVQPLIPIKTEIYQEIGIRSHGRGIFHKNPTKGSYIGSKRVFHCQPGALVFNIVFAWEQAVAVLSDRERGLIASHRFPMYKGVNGQAFEPFFLSFFKTRRGKNGLNIASPGGAGRNKTLGQKEMGYLYVPKPTIPEQEAIAQVLECWDRAIHKYEEKLEKKKSIRKGLMQRLLSGKQRLPGFSGEWKSLAFGNVFSFMKTYPFSRDQLTTETADGAVLYNIHYGDLHATYSGCTLDCAKEKSLPRLRNSSDIPDDSVLLQDGDLVIADVSEDYEGVCACIELKNVCGKKITGGLHTFAARDSEGKTTSGYIGYILKDRSVTNELMRIATGVSVYGVSKRNLARVRIHLPSVMEQRAIALVLSAADEEISALERKFAVLKEQKRYLLGNLVIGCIRLPEFVRERDVK